MAYHLFGVEGSNNAVGFESQSSPFSPGHCMRRDEVTLCKCHKPVT